jgi:predicted ATP-dependent endonuclease of OLD family
MKPTGRRSAITTTAPKGSAATVEDITIEGLFGMHDYYLPAGNSPDNDLQLIVLYGENGSGKSTILRLLFHLLNPEPYNGHRSYVGTVPFRRMIVTLSTGYKVVAEREKPHDLDSYYIQASGPGIEGALKWTWRKDDQTATHEPEYHEFCTSLARQGINLHFLQDSRRTEKIQGKRGRRLSRPEHEHFFYQDSDVESLDPNMLVQKAVEDTLQWFQREVLTGTNEGQSSVNAVYSNLINKLISAKVVTGHLPDSDIGSLECLIQMLKELELKNEKYSRFALTAPLDTKSIRGLLATATADKIDLLEIVLQPYIEGHTARLNALNDIQQILETFVGLLSSFYRDKKVSVAVGKTFSITADNGYKIAIESLSSGEKHLLLLFCNAILARAHGTILIIDEPEISLNIKWQRQLVEALRACMKGVQCQLILATHSFEILAGHDNDVRPLISQKNVRGK